MNESQKELLRNGAAKLDVDITSAQVDAFAFYQDELLKWNRKINLTAITDPREVVIKHFLDSIALVRLVPDVGGRAADIGTGAGFPGLALKIIMPELDMVLIEPSHKRCAFLKHVGRSLGMTKLEVVEAKIEEVQENLAHSFDILFSRAFREPKELISSSKAILGPQGRFLLSAGRETDVLPPDGWKIDHEEDIILPSSDIYRKLIVYSRVG